MSSAESGIEPGTIVLGKYRIESTLGRGGMGIVYRARHLDLDEPVAIKVLRSEVLLDEEAVTRFQREAQAAVRLKSEHVARISDVGIFEDGTPYMVMEFLAGADLGTLIDRHGALVVPDAIDLMLQACDALAEAHALGIVHRDVKPSNLFLTTRPDGASLLKILDFGISKSVTATDLSLTQTASVLGTPAYMSPEQMRSARDVDARTDIWSLGTVLYELAEGRRPFLAETFAEMCVMAAVDPYEPLVLAPELEPIIARCLAKTPDERYPSVADLAHDLAAWASDPNAAAFYVSRTHRVLERGYDASRPIARVDLGSQPIPMARSSVPLRGAAAAVTPSTIMEPRRRPRRWLIATLVVALAGGGAGFVAYESSWNDGDPAAAIPDERGPTVKMEATGSAPLATVDRTPASSAGSGSSATVEGSGSAAGTGSGSGSAAIAAGSDRATDRGSAARAHRGSATAAVKVPVGKRNTRKGGVRKGGGTKRGTVRRGAKVRSGGSRKGAGAREGSGSGSGSAVKKCNPFESRRGC